MKKYLAMFTSLFLIASSPLCLAAVILQYHHVSSDTPASTSISPEQFEAHMQYLADNSYRVVALSELMNSIKKQQPIPDKTIVITFDDAYIDILEQGKPILDKFNYPFTIFVNPGIIKKNSSHYLTWKQLREMADDGVIIANHGYQHDSLARKPSGITNEQWQQASIDQLEKSEQLITKHTGQSWRYFAYPYGEYTPSIQQWIKDNEYIAFSQQSGAVGLATDLTIVPRFPASQPYDKLNSLRDKLRSLPFAMKPANDDSETIFEQGEINSVNFDVVVDDFHKSQLNCYVSGIGKQKIEWQNDSSFTINFSAELPTGRVRSNCTAPSISNPGRYYWYSKPWFILHKGRTWYPL